MKPILAISVMLFAIVVLGVTYMTSFQIINGVNRNEKLTLESDIRSQSKTPQGELLEIRAALKACMSGSPGNIME